MDREWGDEIKSSVAPSEMGIQSQEKSARTETNDHESFAVQGFWGSYWLLVVIRWRLLPSIAMFFDSKFMDEKVILHLFHRVHLITGVRPSVTLPKKTGF